MIALVNVMCRVKAYYFRPDIIREYSQKVTELKRGGEIWMVYALGKKQPQR